jgi:hypothetical protein
LKALHPNQVIENGLTGYKQMMIYKNYLSLIPERYLSDLYCKPSKEVLDAEERARDQKLSNNYKRMKKTASLEVAIER